MGRSAKHAAVGLAVVLAACLLLWEAGQTVTVICFMVILGRFDPRVGAIVTPLAIGAIITAVGASMGLVSMRRGRADAASAWFVVADILAPAIALGGHAVASSAFGVPAV